MKTLQKTRMSKLVLFIVSLTHFSCNSELKVSVFEPLPTEIVQKKTIEDSTFL